MKEARQALAAKVNDCITSIETNLNLSNLADAEAEVKKRAHALLLAKVHEEAEPVLKEIQLKLNAFEKRAAMKEARQALAAKVNDCITSVETNLNLSNAPSKRRVTFDVASNKYIHIPSRLDMFKYYKKAVANWRRIKAKGKEYEDTAAKIISYWNQTDNFWMLSPENQSVLKMTQADIYRTLPTTSDLFKFDNGCRSDRRAAWMKARKATAAKVDAVLGANDDNGTSKRVRFDVASNQFISIPSRLEMFKYYKRSRRNFKRARAESERYQKALAKVKSYWRRTHNFWMLSPENQQVVLKMKIKMNSDVSRSFPDYNSIIKFHEACNADRRRYVAIWLLCTSYSDYQMPN